MKFIDPRAGNEWDDAIAAHPGSSIFHTSAWSKVLARTYGHSPFYFRLNQGDGLAALLPLMEVQSAFTGRRGVCLPFSDFCPHLSFGSNDAGLLLIDRLKDLARERRWNYFELRGAFGATLPAPARTDFFGHKLDLAKSPNELFEGLASSVRRAIRKAERSGLTLDVISDLGAVREFYHLHNQTRRRHGIPPQPFSFFRNIQEEILAPGLGFLVLARLQRQPVAGAMFFQFQTQALFKFGASDDRHQELRANNLVMWEGMKQARERGAKMLHLGRTDFEHAGLRRFKLSLGAEEELLQYFRYDVARDRWMKKEPLKSSNLPGAVFRALPLTVNQLAGTVLYPHLH